MTQLGSCRHRATGLLHPQQLLCVSYTIAVHAFTSHEGLQLVPAAHWYAVLCLSLFFFTQHALALYIPACD